MFFLLLLRQHSAFLLARETKLVPQNSKKFIKVHIDKAVQRDTRRHDQHKLQNFTTIPELNQGLHWVQLKKMSGVLRKLALHRDKQTD